MLFVLLTGNMCISLNSQIEHGLMHHLIKNNTLIFLLTSLFSFASFASDITVINAHMPEVPPVSRTAAIYLTLENKSAVDYELVDASTPIAKHTMIHKTVEKNGTVKMNHIDGLVIKAKGTVKLDAGGTHIMLMGLAQKSISNPFELTLVFKGLGSKSLESKALEPGKMRSQVHKEQTVLVNIIKRQ